MASVEYGSRRGWARDEKRMRVWGIAGNQWAKMATRTIKGMYVIRETPAMMRQRNRQVRASVGDRGATRVD